MSEPRQLPAENLKHRLPKIETLAMLKMEKNFIALEKGYPRQPYDAVNQPLRFMVNRVWDEWKELKEAFENGDTITMKEECADISNIVDYIFEMLVRISK